MLVNEQPASDGFVKSNKSLKNGIWPRSLSLWMTGFYVALFIIRPWEQLLPWLGEIRFERTYALLLITVVFLSRRNMIHMSSQTMWVLFYLVAIGISGLNAYIPELAWEPFYAFFVLVIFYFILISVTRSSYDLIFITICYVFANAVYLFKAQWEFWINGQHIYDMGVVRLIGIESTHGSPNSLAMSIVVSLPIAYFLWVNRLAIIESWPRLYKKWFPRFLLVYLVLATTSLILTNSRSGMLGGVLFFTITAFRGKRIKLAVKYLIYVIILLTVIWQFMPEENKNRLETVWNPNAGPANAQASAEGRIEGFYAGMEMFTEHPITGVGVGNFITYRIRFIDGIELSAHNLVGQVLGETGIIGGLCLLMLVYTIWHGSHKVRKLSQNKRHDTELIILSSLSIAITNSILLLAFEGLFGHNAMRFNWLWLAAFSLLALQFTKERIKELNLVEAGSARL